MSRPLRLEFPGALHHVTARGNARELEKWARGFYIGPKWALVQGRGAAVGYPGSGFVHLDTGLRRSWAG